MLGRTALVALALLVAACGSVPAAPAAPPRAGVRPAVARESARVVRAQPAPVSPLLRAALASAAGAVASPGAKAPAATRASAAALAPLPALFRSEPAPNEPTLAVSKRGRLPPQAIRRVVRQQAGVFRACYQDALRRDATIAGRVAIRFRIGPDGRVWHAREFEVTLADRALRQCALNAFFALTFSNPLRQTIDVEYPLRFSRDASDDASPLDEAQRVAAPPPPGFADAFRSGTPVTPSAAAPAPAPPEPSRAPSACRAGDPMCSDGM